MCEERAQASHGGRSLRILQVSTVDIGGGAERVAWLLFQGFARRGHHSLLAVGRKRSGDTGVLPLDQQPEGPWGQLWWHVAERVEAALVRRRGGARLAGAFQKMGQPRKVLGDLMGLEDFEHPGFRRLWRSLTNGPLGKPDVVHAHNLHGGYFDLRDLAWLSREVPVFLTLHDAWLLSGHCAHSFECERWQTGCGRCPDLSIYPAVRRDATACNWRRKREIYRRSRLRVVTPCQWLMDKVRRSILAEAVEEARIIPYGVDLEVFHPADRRLVRRQLGLPDEAAVLLFAANSIRRNRWKDWQTLRRAIELLGAEGDRGIRVGEAGAGRSGDIVFVALGEAAPPERLGSAEIWFVPFQADPQRVAMYYQAADLYLHAARADTFPNTVLEALACGTPVVATAVGGIPEQVKGLAGFTRGTQFALSEATGVLVGPGDAEAMAMAALAIVTNHDLRRTLGEQAAVDAKRRFNLERQIEEYLAWFAAIGGRSLADYRCDTVI